ncbi:flagellar assembly protein A [uncultured Clostridium sp.]|uniref:flagellar assembly protein A n=1 Tax=Clostridium sp. TaxID=1506 RepID=UPI00267368A1|nr:flagellar assembly protein A [uncultured Clostridium sp.]
MAKNGKIKVVLGKIIVINPVGEGKYPTITPSSKGMLTINGKEIYETTKVNESDEIEFLSNDKLSKNIKVDISKDKMEAYISFEYKNAVKINIKDSNPVENLVIDVYEEEMDCRGLLSKEEIEQLLKEANVVYGVKEEAIEEITKAQNGGRVLVAEGLKPIDAIDEKIEFVFNKEDVSIGEYEKIDYKNINKINGVEATAIIGKVIKGEDSKFGINVFGQEVKPKKNKRKIIRCGNGCNILDDNIIAEISGQVSYKLAIKDGDKNSQVSKFIKEKLLPMSRTNINSIKELRNFVISLLEEIQYLEEYMANMSSITLSYCQEASIQSSGDILINGKGLYSTDMYAVRSIKFLNKQSVCRGGVLKAGEFINASVVGSEAGAHNVLEVFGKKGIVTIEKAYSNTLIIINNKRYLVTEPCRNVKCYIDNKGELAVEKLVL